MFDVEFLRENGGVHGPGKIGGAHTIVDDWTGDAEAGGANFFVAEMTGGDAGKFLGDKIELRKILAAKTLLENGCEPAARSEKSARLHLVPPTSPANITRSPDKFRALQCSEAQRN